MEPKVYKLAIMAAICVAIISFKSYAYQSPTPVPPPTPVVPRLNLEPLVSLVTPMVNNAIATYMANNNKSDKRKVQRLQRQMQKLQGKLSNLPVNKVINIDELTDYYEKQANEIALNFSAGTGQQINPEFEQQTAELDRQVREGIMKVKSKTYSKSYTVDDNDKLAIDNRYGNIAINTWNKNEIKVDVEIKTYANGDADAQRMLDHVQINDSKNNSVIAFTTMIDDNDHKSFWAILNTGGKSAVRKTVINYVVYMPAKNPLSITNSYGGVVLPDLSGKVTIKSTYSNLTSKALTNAGNTINIKYGNANMESLVGSTLQLAYGNLNLQWAENLNANVSYSGVNIGKISNSATINVNYGDGLQIGSLDKNLKNLSVNASYAPVKIGTMNNDNANFDVTVSYGDFKFDDGVNVTSKSPSGKGKRSATQHYKGYIGKGGNNNWIIVRSNYSDVKFDQ